jgi:hypothetical protein
MGPPDIQLRLQAKLAALDKAHLALGIDELPRHDPLERQGRVVVACRTQSLRRNGVLLLHP